MNNPDYVNPSFYGGTFDQRPQQIQEVPNRNPLLSPNADMMSNSDHLSILRQYHKIMSRKQAESVIGGGTVYDYFFGFFNQQANITFYDIKEKPVYDIDFDVAWIDFKMSRPLGKLTQEEISAKTNLKRYADVIFFRSCGAPNGIINERTAEASSIMHNISTGNSQQMQPKRGGILGGLSKLIP